MRTIFLDGQDACHIGQANIIFILQPIAQKVKILFLLSCSILILPEYAIPLINQNHELPLRLFENILHCPRKICLIKIVEIRIFFQQVP